MNKTRAAILWRAGALAVFLLIVVVVALTLHLPSLEQIHSWTESAGILGVTGFIVGFALLTLAPVPKTVISIAAGAVWGLAVGIVVVILGALLGATLAFVLGRLLGRDAVEGFTGGRVRAVDEMLRRRGLLSVIGVRLIPVIPFTFINYTAGLTAVRIRDYALGTVIGIIPGTIAYVAVGAYGAALDGRFFIALGALGVLTIGGIVVAHRLRADQTTPHQVAPEPSGEQPES
ncbi:TVP38/TMEM64 family protein [Salinibacterium sp. TMP30]|uniref:TVP38/TMEM64 family protein n=1 Tax=Salinibacterium sp. TMP30 TaxID=3138237 RepID=UPI00313A4089